MTFQTSSSACMTDLEVILEFLDEHYRQEALEQHKVGDPMLSLPHVLFAEEQGLGQLHAYNHIGSGHLTPVTMLENEQEQGFIDDVHSQPAESKCCPSIVQDTLKAIASPQMWQTPPPLSSIAEKALQPCPAGIRLPVLPHLPTAAAAVAAAATPGRFDKSPRVSATPAPRGRKLRLFHFLFEMLENPEMAHCVAWVPSASAGVFSFSSQNKERVAELWGRRKGNRRPMTYQKMSRALRNYAHSGEIVKVKRKLTYRFNCATLRFLRSQRGSDSATAAQYNQAHQL
ncbi:transcription factor Spi-B [Sardina pilchardus]|uniref:transcription factor Spi-B n=1 Tax=Sardina pilchardus TaxID=27697 RepID=UPI002E15356D